MTKNVFVDMDGTAQYSCGHRLFFNGILPKEELNYRLLNNPVIESTKSIVDNLYSAGYIINIFTARPELDEYDITKQWLDKNSYNYHKLICSRKTVDENKSVISKVKYLKDNNYNSENTLMILDDTPNVIEAIWDELKIPGLLVMQDKQHLLNALIK